MVPRGKLPEYFGKELADKIIEGGRMQFYGNPADVGEPSLKILQQDRRKRSQQSGQEFKAKTVSARLSCRRRNR